MTGDSGQWAIVGGTGEFTLAQGTIFFETVRKNGISYFKELHIGVWYTPIKSLNVSRANFLA
jgi:hypothetical protein